jgi:hypothetical protein
MNTPLTWSEMLSLIRKNTKVKHGRGCDEPTVDAAEQALELNFPGSYKQFLLTVGWLDFDGDEIFGLGDDLPEPYMNVVSKTTDERMPRSLCAFLPGGGHEDTIKLFSGVHQIVSPLRN